MNCIASDPKLTFFLQLPRRSRHERSNPYHIGWHAKCFEKLEVRRMPASKRTLVKPHKDDERYVRRNADGEFTEKQADVGKSLAADRRTKAKKVVPKGQGDRGDTKR
jgi:hypothetical protein